jgi:uncharacterized protein YndB with AHSA1/START domain
MGTFAIERVVAAAPTAVWDVVTDWEGYARWMPLTTMRTDQGPTRVGWSFAGLTGIGPFRFADVMRITHWAPPDQAGPGAFRLVKVGHVLAGWAEVSVLPLTGGKATQLVWREDIVLRPVRLGMLLAPLLDRFNKALFTRVVTAMAAEAARRPGHDGLGR